MRLPFSLPNNNVLLITGEERYFRVENKITREFVAGEVGMGVVRLRAFLRDQPHADQIARQRLELGAVARAAGRPTWVRNSSGIAFSFS